MNRSFLLIPLAIVLLLSACAAGGGSGDRTENQSYIDARLSFAISYPETWAPFLSHSADGPYADYAVTWDVAGRSPDEGSLALSVYSVPDNGLSSDVELMSDVLDDIYPNRTITSMEVERLPSGETISWSGYTPRQTFRTWALSGGRRHFLIVCTAPPDHFSGHLELFERIVNSFRILGRTDDRPD